MVPDGYVGIWGRFFNFQLILQDIVCGSQRRRQKANGSAWVPSKWDRGCGKHFQSGRPHPEAAHPDFTPNVHLGYPTSSSLSVRGASLQEEASPGSSESPLIRPRIRRFERARESCQRAAALLAQQESESERKKMEMAKMCADVELE